MFIDGIICRLAWEWIPCLRVSLSVDNYTWSAHVKKSRCRRARRVCLWHSTPHGSAVSRTCGTSLAPLNFSIYVYLVRLLKLNQRIVRLPYGLSFSMKIDDPLMFYIINAMYTKTEPILHYQPFNTWISMVLPLQQNLQWNILLLEILQMSWDFKQNWFTSSYK